MVDYIVWFSVLYILASYISLYGFQHKLNTAHWAWLSLLCIVFTAATIIVIALRGGETSPYRLVTDCNTIGTRATSLLPKFMDDMELRIHDYDNTYFDMATLETSDVTGGAELFLYQSGYLTIKDINRGSYQLGIPNQEVRQALFNVVIPALTMRQQNDVRTVQAQLFHQMNCTEVDKAMRSLKALVLDVPYSNKKLQSMDMEERYRFIISSIFYAIGLRIQVERMMAKGRIDMVVWAWDSIYVIELKLSKNGGLEAAKQQIRSNLYPTPFEADGKTVIPLAIELDDDGKGLLRWETLNITKLAE